MGDRRREDHRDPPGPRARREDRPRLPVHGEYRRRRPSCWRRAPLQHPHDEHFYNMPTKGNRSRFVPGWRRSSFVEAVTAWIAPCVRPTASRSMASAGNLLRYADHLSRSPAGPGLRGLRHGCAVVEIQEICPPTFISDPFEPVPPCPSHMKASGFSFCSDGIAARPKTTSCRSPSSARSGRGSGRNRCQSSPSRSREPVRPAGVRADRRAVAADRRLEHAARRPGAALAIAGKKLRLDLIR